MKTYKVWSDDLGYPKEDAYSVVPKQDWYDMEDIVDQLLGNKYSDWEHPESPFNISACEVDPEGKDVGDVQTFSVDVDYSPNFYLANKTPKVPCTLCNGKGYIEVVGLTDSTLGQAINSCKCLLNED